MLGVVGKINIAYSVGGDDYEETFPIGEEKEYFLSGCNMCKLVIDEVYYVVDTIYGVNVYFNKDDEASFIVSGNEPTDFEIKEFGVSGTMKIVMF